MHAHVQWQFRRNGNRHGAGADCRSARVLPEARTAASEKRAASCALALRPAGNRGTARSAWRAHTWSPCNGGGGVHPSLETIFYYIDLYIHISFYLSLYPSTCTYVCMYTDQCCANWHLNASTATLFQASKRLRAQPILLTASSDMRLLCFEVCFPRPDCRRSSVTSFTCWEQGWREDHVRDNHIIHAL